MLANFGIGTLALLLEHDLFRKPVPTFRDHALKQRRKLARAQRPQEHHAVREPQRQRHGAPAFELGRLPEHRDARGRKGGIAARAEQPIEIEARRHAIERSESRSAAPPTFAYTEFYSPELKLIVGREYKKPDGRTELIKYDRIYPIKN